MAIVRITSRTSLPFEAMDTIGYIATRQNSRGERLERELFTQTGRTISQEEARLCIAKAPPGTTFFRTVISPDPAREDTNRDLNLKALTEETLLKLAERYKDMDIAYIGAIHDDHTDIRHVHLIALIQKKRLTRADLRSLIRAATVEARSQRHLLDRSQQRRVQRRAPRQPVWTGAPTLPRRIRSAGRQKYRPVCPNCGYGSAMLWKAGGKLECPSCGYKTSRGYSFGMSSQHDRGHSHGLSLGWEKEGGL